MKLVTLHLPEPYIKALDKLVEAKRFPNRAEAMRFAIHDMIRNKDTFEPDPRIESLAKICVAWNKRELSDKEAIWEVWNLLEKDNLRVWNLETTK